MILIIASTSLIVAVMMSLAVINYRQQRADVGRNRARVLEIEVCPICLGLFENYVVTNCIHRFCVRCFHQLWRINTQFRDPVTCAVCRSLVISIQLFTTAAQAEEYRSLLEPYNQRFNPPTPFTGVCMWIMQIVINTLVKLYLKLHFTRVAVKEDLVYLSSFMPFAVLIAIFDEEPHSYLSHVFIPGMFGSWVIYTVTGGVEYASQNLVINLSGWWNFMYGHYRTYT